MVFCFSFPSVPTGLPSVAKLEVSGFVTDSVPGHGPICSSRAVPQVCESSEDGIPGIETISISPRLLSSLKEALLAAILGHLPISCSDADKYYS